MCIWIYIQILSLIMLACVWIWSWSSKCILRPAQSYHYRENYCYSYDNLHVRLACDSWLGCMTPKYHTYFKIQDSLFSKNSISVKNNEDSNQESFYTMMIYHLNFLIETFPYVLKFDFFLPLTTKKKKKSSSKNIEWWSPFSLLGHRNRPLSPIKKGNNA